MVERKTQRSWVTPVAIGIGGLGLAVGLYLALKKPPGVSPGGTVIANFEFDYLGDGGAYVLLVRFGYYKPPYFPFGFDEEETLGHHILDINLVEPDNYKYDYDIVIPDGAKAGNYDAEGSILTPGMVPGHDWIIRAYQKDAINVLTE